MDTADVILLGIDSDQAPVVLEQALSLAQGLSARLLCVQVQTGRLVADSLVNPPAAHPLDEPPEFDAELAKRIIAVTEQTSVPTELRMVSGDAGKALAAVAQEVRARVIVVGTRHAGLRSRFAELLDGSVAVYLAHHQPIPVMVVPQEVTPAP
ncbi:hypothetical protein GCM10027417_15050 [Glutamicibacter endophyticus]